MVWCVRVCVYVMCVCVCVCVICDAASMNSMATTAYVHIRIINNSSHIHREELNSTSVMMKWSSLSCL